MVLTVPAPLSVPAKTVPMVPASSSGSFPELQLQFLIFGQNEYAII